MSTKLINNALLVFNLNFFFLITSTFANLKPNSQLSSQDIFHHIQQQQQQLQQTQHQQQLYSPQIQHTDNDKPNINNHFQNNHVEKEDFSSKLLTSSSQLLPSTFTSSSPISSSLSSSILTSIVNGQLPLDEQDTLKLLQHLKSSSLEDFHVQSLSSSTSTTNPPTISATTSTTSTTTTPSIHSQSLPSFSSSPSSPSSSSFNSFIASIFPTLWAANNNNFNTPLNYPSHKNNEYFRTKMLPSIYIQPIVIPYPLIMNPIQNIISDYTSRFMSGYSSDPTFSSSFASGRETTTQQSTMSSFMDKYDADQMARSNTRRSGINSFSNSPIYYVHIPSPEPFTFIPTISYTTNPVQSTATTSHPTRTTYNSNPYHNPFTIQINPPQPIQTFTTYSSPSLSTPTLSPILNLPISFISNGKPTGIYQLTTSDSSNSVSSPTSSLDNVGGNNGIQLSYHQNLHSQRIPLHNYSQSASIKPFTTAHQTSTSSGMNPFYRPSIIRPHSPTSYQHLNNGLDDSSNVVADSKITNLKRQYFFNGRPEEIYLLSQTSPARNQYQFQHSIYPTFQTAQNDYY